MYDCMCVVQLTQVVKQNSQFLSAAKTASLEAASAFLTLVETIRASAKKADIVRVLRDSNNRNIMCVAHWSLFVIFYIETSLIALA